MWGHLLRHCPPTWGHTNEENQRSFQKPSTVSSSSARHGACELSVTHAGILTGLILFSSYAGSHSCCEFMSAEALSCPPEQWDQSSTKSKLPNYEAKPFFSFYVIWYSVIVTESSVLHPAVPLWCCFSLLLPDLCLLQSSCFLLQDGPWPFRWGGVT